MPYVLAHVEVTAEQAIMAEASKVFRKVRKMAEQEVLARHKVEVDQLTRDIADKLRVELEYM